MLNLKALFTWFLSSLWPTEACNWAASIFDLSNDTWWDNGTLGSKVGVGLIPRALLWASNEATVFFLGFDTPRPRFRGLPSLWWVAVLALSLSSLPLLGRCGESAAAKSCAKEGLGDAGTGTEFCGTLLGFGPGFRLATIIHKVFVILIMYLQKFLNDFSEVRKNFSLSRLTFLS